ncbi:MAG: alpha-galactosidase [Clostridia bacterium]|nr:alpha-galactosidase [Clostridia bacterium]
MKKTSKKEVIEYIITTVMLGLLVYAAYSLWFIFYGTESGPDVHLYTGLSGLALGWFLLIFVEFLFKKASWVSKLLAFLTGNGLVHGLIWGINTSINTTGTESSHVVIKTFSAVFTVSAVTLLITFLSKAKNKYKIANILLAIIYFAVSTGGFCTFNAENIRALEYKQEIVFDTISAEEMKISDEEKQLCREWYNNNILSSVKKYFTFKVNGEEFNPKEWEQSLAPSPEFGSIYQGGQTEYLIYKNKEKELEVTVETTIFDENATCQWTVYIKNTGADNSGVISDFYAIDYGFETGNAELYYSMGSNTAVSDFSLIRKNLTSVERRFSGVDGKPTEKHLPYFNISGEKFGMLLGIGWSGQWDATISESKGITDITAKQEHLEAYLLPDEEIRSPLVSVSFYNNNNPLKGFNLFRNWIMDCVYPENVTQNHYTVMEIAGPTSTRTSDEIIGILDGFDDAVFNETDAFWMDAGWYSYNEGWYDGVGNWTVDTSRYDNGIVELSSYAKEKGLGHVLWYEPERVYRNTVFYNTASEHEQWLIDIGNDNFMWNLADEDAFNYYCEYLLNSMQENGVTIYRQDFNFPALDYWKTADEQYYDGRTGICENHYVTNLYRFLDYLTDNIEGLIIDNCASGGKRLDLEMTYRSIPFWRSDYNCSVPNDLFEVTQSHTYGISFWLPISGTALNMTSEYSSRSAILPLMLMDFYAHQVPTFNFYHEQRDLMTGNYYPLDFGSFDTDKIHAMQYSSEDALSGTAFIYKREKVKDSEYTVVLNGLVSTATYNVYDFDNPEKIYTLTGEELMNDGFTINLPEGEKAIILMFSAKNKPLKGG